ncbi:MAG: DNA mismatch repair endonuclease MutL [Gammaproteobacteria bacterium]|nr:DNA mismatch repair endonuclease MutL [Gammaproteobacteria bacterium]
MMAPARIHALPLHLANQIAAGEVIERPASVVKELIENCIDAKASQIDINIEGAGSKLIHIQDNGEGIHPDDLHIALSRHATSKIHSSEQLSHIASLGFRGEALPSIASVSRLTLTSRQKNSDCAYQITADETEATPASHPVGTSIEIRDLFFNLPARRRFLRSDKTEQHHILTTIQRLALSQFDIGFHYNYAGSTKLKLAIATSLEQQQQRVAKICGKSFIDNSLYINQCYENSELSGWLGKAEAHRAQTDVQYFFINGRVIRDRVINHAIRQAYGEHIPTGRQAAYVLYLTLPLDVVDINVHPTKHEVRFRNARLIHGLIIAAIHDALSTQTAMTHPKIVHVSEQSNSYTIPSTVTLHSAEKNTPSDSILAVLEQRYILTQRANSVLLIDLQQAIRQQHYQQLNEAIKENSLRYRPILVPIVIDANTKQIDAVNNHTDLLAKIAIQCQQHKKGVIVTAIPSLLAHCNIKEMFSAILTALVEEKTDLNYLTTLLQQHIPPIAINNTEQATQLIQQLNNSNSIKKYTITLDQQTLSSLFSPLQ